MSETAGSKALAWVARIWSLSNIVFVLLFIFGEGLSGRGASPAKAEWIGLTLWPVGVTVEFT